MEHHQETDNLGKRYKTLMAIPIALLVIAIAVLVNGYATTGDWFIKGIEMEGGTQIDIPLEQPIDISGFQGLGLDIRERRGLGGYGLIIRTQETDTEQIVQVLKQAGLPTENIGVQTISPEIGEAFWSQAQTAIIIAFVLMGIVVFGVFRKVVVSGAVILAAVSDIIITLGMMQLFGIPLTFASLGALLMLIGYSVDTDILLSTRIMKTAGVFKEKVDSAMRTGLTMSFTTIGALIALLIVNLSSVISEIAAVLLIGMVADIINTWIQNAGILYWNDRRRKT